MSKQPAFLKEKESDIEKSVVSYARRRGVKCSKFTSVGRRDAPDYIFFFGGHVLLLEFKRPGGKPRPTQLREQAKYHAVGIRCEIVDDRIIGQGFIEELVNGTLYI